MDVRPLIRLFRALGDETRLRIVVLLSHGELCVCHIEKALDLNQSNASRQLGILRAAGVVDARRDGAWVYYSLVVQQHELARAALELLLEDFSTKRGLRGELAKLRRSCGPKARAS